MSRSWCACEDFNPTGFILDEKLQGKRSAVTCLAHEHATRVVLSRISYPSFERDSGFLTSQARDVSRATLWTDGPAGFTPIDDEIR